MAGPYAPEDSLIGPIIHQVAQHIRTQIPSIEYVWETVPDRAPSNNQVLLPISRIQVIDDTNGKLKILIKVAARHVFRRRELDAGISEAYTYIMPWLRMLSAWENDTLGGLAIKTSVSDVAITRLVESGQVFIALATDINVLTEFNIDLS